jgi:hypothetical protein
MDLGLKRGSGRNNQYRSFLRSSPFDSAPQGAYTIAKGVHHRRAA